MEPLTEYTIPIEGLKDGMHEFDFQLDSSFFEHFEAAPIQNGNFTLKLYFDKRPDMLVLVFDIKGSYPTECDRCLAAIDLPVNGQEQLLIKYASQAGEDADVVYITRETKLLNIAKYVYEYVCLSVPMVKTYECETEKEPPCNQEMLAYLNREATNEPETETNNPIWEALKGLDKKE